MGGTLTNMLAANPSLDLTTEGTDHKRKLELLMYVHLGIAISKVIIMGFAFGFGDLIQCLILYCGFSQHSFCNVYIYMLACMMLGF